jgi:hypothetical protein
MRGGSPAPYWYRLLFRRMDTLTRHGLRQERFRARFHVRIVDACLEIDAAVRFVGRIFMCRESYPVAFGHCYAPYASRLEATTPCVLRAGVDFVGTWRISLAAEGDGHEPVLSRTRPKRQRIGSSPIHVIRVNLAQAHHRLVMHLWTPW